MGLTHDIADAIAEEWRAQQWTIPVEAIAVAQVPQIKLEELAKADRAIVYVVPSTIEITPDSRATNDEIHGVDVQVLAKLKAKANSYGTQEFAAELATFESLTETLAKWYLRRARPGGARMISVRFKTLADPTALREQSVYVSVFTLLFGLTTE